MLLCCFAALMPYCLIASLPYCLAAWSVGVGCLEPSQPETEWPPNLKCLAFSGYSGLPVLIVTYVPRTMIVQSDKSPGCYSHSSYFQEKYVHRTCQRPLKHSDVLSPWLNKHNMYVSVPDLFGFEDMYNSMSDSYLIGRECECEKDRNTLPVRPSHPFILYQSPFPRTALLAPRIRIR